MNNRQQHYYDDDDDDDVTNCDLNTEVLNAVVALEKILFQTESGIPTIFIDYVLFSYSLYSCKLL